MLGCIKGCYAWFEIRSIQSWRIFQEEQALLLQRTFVRFPEPTSGWLQPHATPLLWDLTPSLPPKGIAIKYTNSYMDTHKTLI